MSKKNKYDRYQYSLFDDAELGTTTISGGRDMRPQPSVSEINAPFVDLHRTSTLHFISFGSGSSGNCSYLGSADEGILVDAGIEPKQVVDTLKYNNIPASAIKGIFLTHDHGDHVRYVYTLTRMLRTSIYCTPRVLSGILRKHSISRRVKDYHKPIYKEIPVKLAGLEITAFDVPHDGSCNSGYNISMGNTNFVIATDMGEIIPGAQRYMNEADFLMIESNYDAKMLKDGTYADFLKHRIMSDHGHLDNVDAAKFLAEHAGGRLKYAFLCHLSKDNNTPEIALNCAKSAIEAAGHSVGDGSETLAEASKDVQLIALPRFEATRCYKFIVNADNDK
ncbi:MAG: MBL fold metallo-hydrolase [Candidatus Limisoma sp.]|nr:MBL fold metallo-hydrolase [Candidatus Limisoma sp.]